MEVLTYTLDLLGTNRILKSSVISKNEVSSSSWKESLNPLKLKMYKDFRELRNASTKRGIRSFYRGFSPFMTQHLFNGPDFESLNPSLEKYFSSYKLAASFLLLNPLSIICTRMQFVDSVMNKSFYGVFSETVKGEGLSIFYRGLFPNVLSAITMIPFYVLSKWEGLREYHKKYAFPSALAGLLLSHPFYVIGVKLFAGSLHHTQVEREAYRNTMRAVLYTAKTEGLLGFYRGFVPMTIVRAACFYNEIQDAFNAFTGKSVVIKE